MHNPLAERVSAISLIDVRIERPAVLSADLG
jgi:hypothetical protein